MLFLKTLWRRCSRRQLILALDTSGSRCGVALWEKNLLGYVESDSSLRHDEVLLGQIQELLEQHKINPQGLSAIAVSSGPGSFTGLRVGMATAKGLCWTWNLPLICVGTLEALAASVPARLGRTLTLMPARAREVYWRLHEHRAEGWVALGNCSASDISALPDAISGNVFLCGEGYQRHREDFDQLFGSRRLTLSANEMLEPLVVSTARLAARRLAAGQFDDLMRAEPEYHYPFPAKGNLPSAAIGK